MIVPVPEHAVVEIAHRSPTRRALYISAADFPVVVNFGLIDAAAAVGLPLGLNQGPLLVSGRMAADRWTAYSPSGAASVGVLEIFDVWP